MRHRHCFAPTIERGPEAQRGAERKFGIERGRLGHQGSRALAFDAAGGRREQPGGDADQARLADAVGACDQRGLAGREHEVQPFEQQPSAAQTRDAAKGQARHSAPSSSACMSSSESPK
jgi:hypothetical protein